MSTASEDISAKIALAVTANESGDYAAALTYLRSARMLAVARPTVAAKSGASVQYSVYDIDAMIADIKSAVGANLGIQRQPVTYKRVDEADV